MKKIAFAEELVHVREAYRLVYNYQAQLHGMLRQTEHYMLKKIHKLRVIMHTVPSESIRSSVARSSMANRIFAGNKAALANFKSLGNFTKPVLSGSSFVESLCMQQFLGLYWAEFRFFLGKGCYFSFLHVVDSGMWVENAVVEKLDTTHDFLPIEDSQSFVFLLMGKSRKAHSNAQKILSYAELFANQVFNWDSNVLVQRFPLTEFAAPESIQVIVREFKFFVEQHSPQYLSFLK